MRPVFVQFRCDPGTTYEVAEAIYDREVVSELYSTSGEYDLIAKVYIPEDEDVGRYLSEKLFDAFACGAVPLYLASPGHHLHRMGLPDGAWVNLFGLTEAGAAARIAAWEPTTEGASAYCEAQARLAALFGDTRLWLAERQRLGRALVAEVTRLVDLGAAAVDGITAAGAAAA